MSGKTGKFGAILECDLDLPDEHPESLLTLVARWVSQTLANRLTDLRAYVVPSIKVSRRDPEEVIFSDKVTAFRIIMFIALRWFRDVEIGEHLCDDEMQDFIDRKEAELFIEEIDGVSIIKYEVRDRMFIDELPTGWKRLS